MNNEIKLIPGTQITALAIDFHDRIRFWDWCRDNGITTRYEGCEIMSGQELWSFDNDEHRMLAILRWL